MSKINPIYNEDYESQWGKLDYKGKIVLDIGGSNGDTCSYFLSKGASVCICVDINQGYIDSCRKSVNELGIAIVPIQMDMNSPDRWETLINLINPDVIKSDVEGIESNLILVSDDVFKKVSEYIIETHGDNIFHDIVDKANRCGYLVVNVNEWTPTIRIIYLRRNA